jgi:hypothetical protein
MYKPPTMQYICRRMQDSNRVNLERSDTTENQYNAAALYTCIVQVYEGHSRDTSFFTIDRTMVGQISRPVEANTSFKTRVQTRTHMHAIIITFIITQYAFLYTNRSIYLCTVSARSVYVPTHTQDGQNKSFLE